MSFFKAFNEPKPEPSRLSKKLCRNNFNNEIKIALVQLCQEEENQLFTLVKKILELIPKFSLVTAGLALILITLFIVIEVVARSVFRYSVPFAIEYSEYLIPVVALLGAAYVLKEEGHVRADIIVSHLSDRLRLWFDLIGYIAGLVFLVVLDIQTCTLVLKSFKYHYTSLYPMRTPLGYVQLMLPIGLSLFILQLVIEIVKKIKLLFTNYK
jgi:TRAP-type mannitol/chloroaromatic compound transport system permease small subunit